jgi:hypothetical protein
MLAAHCDRRFRSRQFGLLRRGKQAATPVASPAASPSRLEPPPSALRYLAESAIAVNVSKTGTIKISNRPAGS